MVMANDDACVSVINKYVYVCVMNVLVLYVTCHVA